MQLPTDLQSLLSEYSFNSFVPSMLFLLAIIRLASATCYLANGTADSAPYIAQCPSNFASQMCCWLVNLPNPDNCTTQGICLSNYNRDDPRKYVDGCTDSDWGSGCSPLGKLCRTLCHFPFTLILVSNAQLNSSKQPSRLRRSDDLLGRQCLLWALQFKLLQ